MKVGDKVTRLLSGTIPMELRITAVDDEFIHCGPWKFDRTYGYEVDEEIGWGMKENGEVITGSFLQIEEEKCSDPSPKATRIGSTTTPPKRTTPEKP